MKRHNLKNRNEKIKFLKELQTGRATVSEILPMVIEIWEVNKKEKTLYNTKTTETLSEEMYEERIKREGINVIKIGC